MPNETEKNEARLQQFAAAAMTGLLASYAVEGQSNPKPEIAAAQSMKYAVELNREFNRTMNEDA